MAFGKNGLVSSRETKPTYTIYRKDNGKNIMSCKDKVTAEEHLQSLKEKMNVDLAIKEIELI